MDINVASLLKYDQPDAPARHALLGLVREWQCRGAGFEGQTQGAGGERDRVIPAGEQHEIQGAILADYFDHTVPLRVAEVVIVVQCINRVQYGSIGRIRPTWIVGPAEGQRPDLLAGQGGLRSEDRDVDAPFVFRFAERGRPVDDELPVAQRERQFSGKVVAAPAVRWRGLARAAGRSSGTA